MKAVTEILGGAQIRAPEKVEKQNQPKKQQE
jgi:hypothetical protein